MRKKNKGKITKIIYSCAHLQKRIQFEAIRQYYVDCTVRDAIRC